MQRGSSICSGSERLSEGDTQSGSLHIAAVHGDLVKARAGGHGDVETIAERCKSQEATRVLY